MFDLLLYNAHKTKLPHFKLSLHLKFTMQCSVLERGNSVEDDRSPGVMTSRSSPPPTIHLSPTRQSSSSTDGGGGQTNNSSSGTTVAKKKRELFSARSSRSGGSNKSSEASIDYQSSSSKVKNKDF